METGTEVEVFDDSKTSLVEAQTTAMQLPAAAKSLGLRLGGGAWADMLELFKDISEHTRLVKKEIYLMLVQDFRYLE